MFRAVVAGSVVALSAAACQAAPAFKQPVEGSARQAFTIDLPQGCDMSGGDQQLDFAILQITCDGVPVVGIYAGNGANIDSDNQGLVTRPDVQDRNVIVAANDPEATVHGYLWQTHYDWPHQLHIWIMGGQERNPKAQQIAASVRPTEPGAMSGAASSQSEQ